MFLSRIVSTVYGRTVREARKKYAPDGRVIGEFTLACGDGSVRFPTMFVKVSVWEELAKLVLPAVNKKGMCIEVGGYLVVTQYEGKYGKCVLMDLKEVREVRIYDRDGVLEEVLSGEKITEQEVK